MSNPKPKLPPRDIDIYVVEDQNWYYLMFKFKDKLLSTYVNQILSTKHYRSKKTAVNFATKWCDKHNFTWEIK